MPKINTLTGPTVYQPGAEEQEPAVPVAGEHGPEPTDLPAGSTATVPVDSDGPADVDGDGVIDQYEALTKPELVDACAHHQLPLSTLGTKADLVRRLQAADKAKDGGI